MSISIIKTMIFSFVFRMVFMAEKGAGQNVTAVFRNASENEYCREARCGEYEPLIKFPFRLKDSQPSHCGYPGFDLTCSSANKTVLLLPNFSIKLFILDIDYEKQFIYVNSQDECGVVQKQDLEILSLLIFPFQFAPSEIGSTLFNCSSNNNATKLPRNSPIPCLSDHVNFVRVYGSRSLDIGYHPELVSCRKMFEISSVPPEIFQRNSPFGMTWSTPSCGRCEAKGKRCRLKKHGSIDETECFKASMARKGIMIAGIVCSSLVLIPVAIALFHVYTTDKKERENRLRVKKFLEEYQAFQPSRLTYRDIKKITSQFKEKLGEGAYGTVFKGKLSNEVLVAVKILNNSKGNGEEFINEVATMGQIHHVNVVRLVGYCAEGLRRALIYEFLPNDSLDKYISSVVGGTHRSLSWEMLQDIAVGIAKGIEYLHQGCDQRILHFDIKPHNILLDLNFIPKISDFGLAKLCAKDQSLVSMSTARGTMGYIAPEVFSRNFGNVSYKSDVYSFGMLLLEMIGGRKNTNVTRENTEEIYYPEWIYNLLEEGDDLRIHIEEEEGDVRIAKKLAIVGLWCIQWHPIGRPTMKAAVQMLEAGEELTLPPNPFASMGPSTTNNKMHARRMALELEAIAE